MKSTAKFQERARIKETMEAARDGIEATLPPMPGAHIEWHDQLPPRPLFTERQMREYAVQAILNTRTP